MIGTLTVTDPDHTTGFTYTLSDDRFEVVNNQLKLKDLQALDYEQETEVSIDIMVTDPTARTTRKPSPSMSRTSKMNHRIWHWTMPRLTKTMSVASSVV